MSLYYLKGSATQSQSSPPPQNQPLGNSSPGGSRGRRLLLLIGSLIIVGAAILQAVDCGLLWTWERKVIRSLPAAWQPTLPKMVLLSMGAGKEGFAPLDLAIALRGLWKLHPARVLIHGTIAPAPANEPIPLLQGVISRLGEEGMEIIIPQTPSPERLWQFLPLCCYEPPAALRAKAEWPLAQGHAAPSGKESFLPNDDREANTLPLFATTEQGEIIGSLWWKAVASFTPPSLPSTAGTIWLLGRRILIFPNHAVIPLNEHGAIVGGKSLPPRECKMVPLADFLLKMEQKERGTLSPDFDALWENSMVIIGTPSDLTRVSLLAAVQSRLALRCLPILLQAALALLWITLLVLGYRHTRKARITLAIILIFLSVIASLFALHHGWILPWLPPLLTSLFLLILVPILRIFRQRR